MKSRVVASVPGAFFFGCLGGQVRSSGGAYDTRKEVAGGGVLGGGGCPVYINEA
jgi:hypothetical protein